ncbi:MAG: hypothetical protein ACI90V_010789 [Bacillariaceae sp.]|jgi:hypothetical protein
MLELFIQIACRAGTGTKSCYFALALAIARALSFQNVKIP